MISAFEVVLSQKQSRTLHYLDINREATYILMARTILKHHKPKAYILITVQWFGGPQIKKNWFQAGTEHPSS